MIPEKLSIVDADTLLSTPIEKTLFIVEGLIPQGVTLLGGSSKIGKSWLMLSLGLRVARGLPLWGLRTQRCDVLYLSLEDTMSRLQNRLYRLTDEAPPGLRFATVCGKLGSGLEEQITQALCDYPATKLVIIDTLQKARDSRSAAGKTGLYSADYDDMSALKQIADRQGIAIVLVHHLRKLPDGNDPFNQLSGSTGITGAADTSMVLLRQRGSDTATLLATGRDIDYQRLTLRFENLNWQLVERAESADLQREQIPPVLFRLVAFLRQYTEWTGTATELLSSLGERETPSNVITKYLGRYANDVLRPAGITYRTRRTGQSRLLCFTHDGHDSNDGNSGI